MCDPFTKSNAQERSDLLFGRWSVAFYTMLQLATSEGWPDVARSLWKDEDQFDPLVGWYFLVYVLAVTTILMNVAMAILLDEFLGAVSKEKENKKKENLEEILKQSPELCGPIDPLLDALSYFATPSDLDRRIDEVFFISDTNGSNAVSMKEFMVGMNKLKLSKKVHLHPDDWDRLTEQGELCDVEGVALSLQAFRMLVKNQLTSYSYRALSQSMNGASGFEGNLILALKMILRNEELGIGYTDGPSVSKSDRTPTGSARDLHQPAVSGSWTKKTHSNLCSDQEVLELMRQMNSKLTDIQAQNNEQDAKISQLQKQNMQLKKTFMELEVSRSDRRERQEQVLVTEGRDSQETLSREALMGARQSRTPGINYTPTEIVPPEGFRYLPQLTTPNSEISNPPKNLPVTDIEADWVYAAERKMEMNGQIENRSPVNPDLFTPKGSRRESS
mmetsp:Transcript_26451/g.41353  ORF Transcript_26451/g.41353 Transcript_26451/m.41353 type:complete len:446 (+) Transcript_26451:1306-2643(+)